MKVFCYAVLFVVSVGTLGAQSLGEVARKEAERRKGIAAPGKVYTNESLRKEPAPEAPSQPSAPPSPSLAQAQKPNPNADQKTDQKTDQKSAAVDATKTEAYWHQKVKDARDGLARSQTFAEALQSRINALSTDFVNRDDPAQRQQISIDRQKAIAELDRVKKDITQQQKSLDDLQEQARRAGIPPGWLR